MELRPAEIALAAVGVILLVVLFWTVRTRRATNRRLMALAARMSEEGLELEGKGGLEKTLSHLERATSTAMAKVADADQAEQRLQLAFAQLSEGVVVCDEQGEVVFRNAAAQQALEGEGSDVLAQDALKRLLKGAAEGHDGAETLELYGPPRRTLAISARPLETAWRGVGAVAVIEDVSERRRLEAVRRDFVSNMSHELKAPVGALWLLAETLGNEEDPNVMNRLAERIQTEAQRVGRIMDDLLDLTRIESEETPTREPVPVHLIVAQAAERVRAVAEQRGVRIRIGEPPRHLAVLGDRRQLISALYNLMENAVKFSEDGGTVEVGGRTDGRWVELRVRDHGIGIPSHDHERIFERFYRVDRGKGRESGGTGLGLAIVRHVASNHGGEVLVDSKEGAGSTFTLRLPLSPNAGLAVSAP
ncbi:MAG: ATP-binding protein [Actinomycetota bacterium]|nr:ATP-binding protein [Actinomycetota bacterium]